jgi:hypothetical protein
MLILSDDTRRGVVALAVLVLLLFELLEKLDGLLLLFLGDTL